MSRLYGPVHRSLQDRFDTRRLADNVETRVVLTEILGKLYRPPGHPWRCRKCYQLTYATRQAAPRQRLILKAQKIREQLGGKLGVLDDFPEKPKGMHWQRYDRLRRVHDQAVQDSIATLAPFAERMVRRVRAPM